MKEMFRTAETFIKSRFLILLSLVIPLQADAVVTISRDYSYTDGYVHYLDQPAYTLPASGITVKAKYADERTTYQIQVPSGYRAKVSITYTRKGTNSSGGFLVVRNALSDWEGQYNVGRTFSNSFTSSVTLELRAYCTVTYSGSNISELWCYYDISVTYETLTPDLTITALSTSPAG